MSKEMMINTVEGHECRIAVVEDGVMEELYIERVSSASRVGNIYKGRVTNVEAAIQAAFIDFGMGKNGFLHISDLNPQYFPRGQKGGAEAVGKKRSFRDRPPIQECLRRGQEVLVQMTKEGIGTKGPTLTTYLSIPGRMLVMMPGMSRLGVSRKIQDEQARQQARQILEELKPPSDMGFILRTAGLDRTKRDLQRDLHYLTRLWKSINVQIKTLKAPAEIYQESDLVIRTLRDVYNTDIGRIICDSESVARRVREFLDMAMPRTKHLIELYTGKEGLFHDMGLETEIEKVFSRRVELRSGGWLALDQAEALVAIDVNSGRFREHSDAETTATKINLEAAKDIARQLRLRDMGGVIIIDFIDMREEKNRRAVDRALREEVKKDRAKTKVLKISAFGIVEMTRQRVRPSLRDSIFRRCPSCDGTAMVKSDESQALSVMRSLQRAVCHEDISQIEVAVTAQVAHHLSNAQRHDIAQLETASGKQIIIKADPMCRGDEVRITCTNSRGSVVAWEQQPQPMGKRPLQTLDFAQVYQPTPGLELEPEEGEFADEEVIEAQADAAAEPVAAPAVPPQAPQSPRPPAPVHAPAAPAVHAPDTVATPPPTASGTPGEGGEGGEPGAGGKKRRRRGRRGGQRHRRHGQEAQGQPGQPPQGDQPQQPAQAARGPQGDQPQQPRQQQQPRPPQQPGQPSGSQGGQDRSRRRPQEIATREQPATPAPEATPAPAPAAPQAAEPFEVLLAPPAGERPARSRAPEPHEIMAPVKPPPVTPAPERAAAPQPPAETQAPEVIVREKPVVKEKPAAEEKPTTKEKPVTEAKAAAKEKPAAAEKPAAETAPTGEEAETVPTGAKKRRGRRGGRRHRKKAQPSLPGVETPADPDALPEVDDEPGIDFDAE